MGQPVAGNPTQYMMEKAFDRAGLDWRYLTFEVPPADFESAMRGFRAFGFRGGNFTIPHKQAVLAYCDELSEAAGLIGAVNCIVRDGEKLIGHNTDGQGFLKSLRAKIDPTGKRIVLLGAGGAARAVAVELALAGAAHVTIVNRTPERGKQLAEHIAGQTPAAADFAAWEGDYAVPAEADVLVNATSIGLNDADAHVPIEAASLRPGLFVADVVFNPPQTRLLEEATARGCTTLDGLGMLVAQGAIGFALWTGVEPDTEVMREAVEEFLGL
jgi:shikimate dehydrogenase